MVALSSPAAEAGQETMTNGFKKTPETNARSTDYRDDAGLVRVCSILHLVATPKWTGSTILQLAGLITMITKFAAEGFVEVTGVNASGS